MRVTDTDLTPLGRFERAALRVGSFVNERPRVKSITQHFNRAVTSRWMTLVSERRIHLEGLEHVTRLAPERGVVLAANHRSFFDMYMILTYLTKHVSWCKRALFPVKSGFWYDHPLGMLTNALASAMSMYPPVFRETEKRAITRRGLDFLAEELQKPGTVVGIHPEGTRNKGSDPYALLPPEQGFGRLVLTARPLVLPIFVNGMTNDFVAECRSTFDGSGVPIIIAFGSPIDFGTLLDADRERLRSQIAVSRRALDVIAELGRAERALRARLTA
ncbi:MAG: lysophospholipid acyltransferase family protein [Sorangiineae bacterium]|nr:lysophospholipid acyltransferase family protein [Polyangiaceae bacterium]MEB2322066.1 lysophospholipid acyltransferase family protein [Sorangiineae bacterium]